MDKETLEQFQLLFSAIEDVRAEMKESETRLEQKIKESETRTHVYIKNQVSKRIDFLFDGYKLTHEKQWELERETAILKEQVSDLEKRLAVLESKIA